MRKNIIRLVFVALALTGALLVIGSTGRPSQRIPCEESMDQCCEKKNRGTDNLILETLSGQFSTSMDLN